jgi:cobyrinic acid a,c-diamide synthase
MLLLPRVAVGTLEPAADSRAILWALMEAFRQKGMQVQSFLSRACFASYHGTATATGLNPRHLDSWLMSPELCRQIFIRGTENCDLAVVEGKFAGSLAEENGAGGSLDTLCEWLDLPRVVVLDLCGSEDCRLPEPRGQVDALLLDRVGDSRHLAGLTTELEALWGVPVLGALELLPGLRAEIDAVAVGTRPPRELCQRLGRQFLRHGQPQRILELAFRRELAWVPPDLFASDPAPWPLVVALAYDNVFDCYFPDTLDLLESRGATILDFSPLRDERLPPGTDIVYLGCGHPERYAAELSQNHCIKLALRNHLRNGGRMYAEGGGLAYLCQEIEIAEGDLRRMVGVFPAIARPNQTDSPPTPVEVTLDREIWLGPPGTRLRGYRNPSWHLEPAGTLASCVVEPDHRYDLVRSSRAIGSRLHLNFAALPNLLPSFFQPHVLQSDPADPWTAVP